MVPTLTSTVFCHIPLYCDLEHVGRWVSVHLPLIPVV